jgi:hypothetical protein
MSKLTSRMNKALKTTVRFMIFTSFVPSPFGGWEHSHSFITSGSQQRRSAGVVVAVGVGVAVGVLVKVGIAVGVAVGVSVGVGVTVGVGVAVGVSVAVGVTVGVSVAVGVGVGVGGRPPSTRVP